MMATKKRLVFVEEVETELRAYADRKHACGQTELASGILKAANHLQTISTARDAVEVVRCKDCKHYDNSEGIQWCHLNSKFYPGGFDWHSFPEDGFCSYGERRSE